MCSELAKRRLNIREALSWGKRSKVLRNLARKGVVPQLHSLKERKTSAVVKWERIKKSCNRKGPVTSSRIRGLALRRSLLTKSRIKLSKGTETDSVNLSQMRSRNIQENE